MIKDKMVMSIKAKQYRESQGIMTNIFITSKKEGRCKCGEKINKKYTQCYSCYMKQKIQRSHE